MNWPKKISDEDLSFMALLAIAALVGMAIVKIISCFIC